MANVFRENAWRIGAKNCVDRINARRIGVKNCVGRISCPDSSVPDMHDYGPKIWDKQTHWGINMQQRFSVLQ